LPSLDRLAQKKSSVDQTLQTIAIDNLAGLNKQVTRSRSDEVSRLTVFVIEKPRSFAYSLALNNSLEFSPRPVISGAVSNRIACVLSETEVLMSICEVLSNRFESSEEENVTN
jgi:hypothetical protein